MSKIKHFFEQSWLLITSAFCFGLLIAATDAAWAPKIEQNKIEKLNRLMTSLLPQAKKFELQTQLEIKSLKGKPLKTNLYKALSDSNECLGWAFNISGSGFADKIELVVAVDKNFNTFAGYSVLSSNETPGFGDRIKLSYYRSQFQKAPVEELKLLKAGDPKIIDSEIIAITGATVSSEAVLKIINNCVKQTKTQALEQGLIHNDK
jgi:electron transport complex protein RnfG